MSEAKRAWNILRGYVNREWDRVNSIEMSDAERELMESLEVPAAPNGSPPPLPRIETENPMELARKVLGVAKEAKFIEVRKKRNELIKRCDAAKFDPGTPEATKVADLRRRIEWAYGVLSADADPTQKRFGTLEIE